MRKYALLHFHKSRFILPLILLVLLLIAIFPAFRTYANQPAESVDLGIHYEILLDPSNELTIEHLITGEYDASFTSSTEKYPSFFHTDDTIWLKLQAADIMTDPKRLHWLEYNDKIESLNVYTVKKDGSYTKYENGLDRLQNQPFDYPALLFPFDGSGISDIYLELRGEYPLTIFTKLYSNHSFIEHVISYKFFTGIFYGFLLALAMYNLFLYFSFKERSYLFYTLYMFSFMLFQATMNSFDVELLGTVLPAFMLTKTLALSCNLMIVFMVLFGREFLDMKQHLPRSYRLLNIVIAVAVISSIALFTGIPQTYTDAFITTFNLFVLLFLWISGLRLLIKGHKSARFYMLGWTVLLGSIMLQALVMLGILPMSLIVFEEIPAYSAMFEALVLSLALADKVNLLIKENRRTQDELHETLEKKVAERTRQLEEAQIELQHLANTDALTQIPNRVMLDHVLEKEFQMARETDSPLSVMLIDLDYFKSVNDTFGHQVGDYVLIEAAKIFKTTVRPSDTVGRWGGEEFLVICPATALDEVLQLAENMRAELEAYHFIDVGQKTASFGVASLLQQDTLHSIISRSDEALYAAKEKGRNRVEFIRME